MAAQRLLHTNPQLDGIVCVNDLYAVGVLEYAHDTKRAVPGDIQIIGFDDQPLMDHLGLSTVRQPMDEFGHWAATCMKTLLIDRAEAPASLELPLTLIRRATTR